jgi:transposase-like protein
MVILVLTCPHCGERERVRRHGRTRRGSERLYCAVCRRAFTPSPKSRSLSEEKKTHILNALAEKMPIIAICRTFQVSPKTVYALLKKT